MVNGSSVYVGGQFTNIGGQSRANLAQINGITGFATSWNPQVTGGNGIVRSLVLNGSSLYVGGEFTSAGGASRFNLAAIDLGTGVATSWSPDPSASVYTMAVKNDTLFLGGRFTTISAQSRSKLAAFKLTDGSLISWDPNIQGAASVVRSLDVNDTAVFAGGTFTTVGGQSRNNLASVYSNSGLPTTWDPNVTGGTGINSLAINSNLVFIGGDFTTVGGQLRSYLAALNATSGAPTSWLPDPSSSVNSLMVSGTTLYAGGDFTTIGQSPVAHFAGFSLSETLPLKLSSFTATIQKDLTSKVQCNWTTAYEQNVSYFEVERSIDANNFYSIGRVSAQGLSTTPSAYSLVDYHPAAAVNYYRLKMVDQDGTYSYSKIEAVILSDSPSNIRLFTYPNPCRENIRLTLQSYATAVMELKILDQSGRIRSCQTITVQKGLNNYILSSENLPAGIYTIVVENRDQKYATQLVKL